MEAFPGDTVLNRRDGLKLFGALMARAMDSNMPSLIEEPSDFDESLAPDWLAFAKFAESGPHHLWSDCPTPNPKKIRLGETIVGKGKGRKNLLVLGTSSTVEASSPSLRGRSLTPMPCGLYVGSSGTLRESMTKIEAALFTNWELNPEKDSSDWKNQRMLYEQLWDWHLGFHGDSPGLIWIVPFWVPTANNRMKTHLKPPRTTCVLHKRGTPLYFGSGRVEAFKFDDEALKSFRFQSPSPERGYDEKDMEIAVIKRTRAFKSNAVFSWDNFICLGRRLDAALQLTGFNRTTEEYFQKIDGWSIHGAWIIMSAVFEKSKIGNDCIEISYTHRVIDPETHRTHGIGLARMQDYNAFWNSAFGLRDKVAELIRRSRGRIR